MAPGLRAGLAAELRARSLVKRKDVGEECGERDQE